MKKFIKIVIKTGIFIALTIITQIGGIAIILSELLCKRLLKTKKISRITCFIIVYSILTFVFVPVLAPIFGREKVKHSNRIRPTNYLTVILNRNYVTPELNYLLKDTENNLSKSKIRINYLDANFPFVNRFPLLPHLSHNDGKKIDLSLVYEYKNGEISHKQKSISGYGIFEGPKENEINQIKNCHDKGHFQYDYPKYLSFGEINKTIEFSESGTKELIKAILKNESLGKLFIEPHLKDRLNLKNKKVRYHGCRAVRHDDHIHIQLK